MEPVIKTVAKDSANWAINSGAPSNETNIKVTPEIAQLFGNVPSDNEKYDVSFYIFKEDFVKSLCCIFGRLPLAKTKTGKLVNFSQTLFAEDMKAIEDFFGQEAKKQITASLAKPGSHSLCLNFGAGNFPIREFLLEKHSELKFTKDDGTGDVSVHVVFEPKLGDDKGSCSEIVEMKLQQIYYGAPGTGKSNTVKSAAKQMPKDNVFRTTFHPDSDYSTFVGAYKPTTIDVPIRYAAGNGLLPYKDENGKDITEQKVVYNFVPQTFLKAYLKAWEDTSQKVALVIEEINRGNCAQIFGDLFQLLDRRKGFSDYPINADSDLKQTLAKEFEKFNRPSESVTKAINELYSDQYSDAVEQIWNGSIMVLPSNLYIWATMNTSDQSLFPIDSAFKRRWDWKYVKIKNAELGWQIKFDKETIEDENGVKNLYAVDWWDFLTKINAIINNMTDSADKQLGYFFCQAENSVINAEAFVSKVVFYLWNDVFKNYGFDDPKLFGFTPDGTDSQQILSFPDFYLEDGSVNEHVAATFIDNIMNWKSSSN